MTPAMAVTIRVDHRKQQPRLQHCVQDKAKLFDFIVINDELASRIIEEFEKGKFALPSVYGLEYRRSEVDFIVPQKLNHVKFSISSKRFNFVVNACKNNAFYCYEP